MATRRTQLDIRTKGGDRAKRELKDIGTSGQNAFRRIDKSSKPANRAMLALSKTSRALQNTMARLAGPQGIAALTAAGAGFGLMATRALNAAESLNDVAERTGVGVERLQELQFAFDQNGVAVDATNAGLRRFRRRLDLAREGTGAATDTLEKLNVNLDQETGAALEEVIRKLSRMAQQEDITGEASQLFGEDAGPAMAVLLRQGVEEIDKYGDRLRELGGFMSDDIVRAGAQASAELRTLRRVTGTTFQVGLIEGFIGEFETFADAVSDPAFQQGVKDLGQLLGETGAFVARHGEETIRILGAFAGLSLGGRIAGKPGAIVGGLIGAFSPEIAELMREPDALEKLRARADALAERLATIEDRAARPAAQADQDLLGSLQEKAQVAAAELFEVERAIARLSGGGRVSQDLAPGFGERSGFDPGPSRVTPRVKPEVPESFDVADANRVRQGGTTTGAEIVARSKRNIQVLEADQKALAETVIRATDTVAEQREELSRLGESIRRSLNPEVGAFTDRMENLQLALDAGKISYAEFRQAGEQAAQQLGEQAAQSDELARAADDLGFTFSSAFEEAIVQGRELSEVLQGLAQDIARIALRTAVTKPLGNAFSDLVGGFASSLLGGGLNLSAGTAALDSGASLSTAANVDIAANPGVFARGGIADRPSIFGEAGPEAAVPLPDGRSIPVTLSGTAGPPPISVQIVNEGPPLEVERSERGTGPDGRTQIKLLVRGQMKEAINEGAMDREMASNFGLRRQGRR